MLAALILSTLAMTLIVALRYLATSGFFAWLTTRRKPGYHAKLGPQMRREIAWSLASAAIYGLPAGIVGWGWQDFPLWYLPLSVLLYLFAHDSWFYWSHRWMHRPKLFRTMHAVHHASRPPTAWAAMSFHPYEALTGAFVIPLLVFVIPIHAAMLGLVLAIMTLMGVTNHMGWEMFPRRLVHSRLGGWLITASHHQRHHEEYRCNYGLYFRFWDRVCGTDKGLSNAI